MDKKHFLFILFFLLSSLIPLTNAISLSNPNVRGQMANLLVDGDIALTVSTATDLDQTDIFVVRILNSTQTFAENSSTPVSLVPSLTYNTPGTYTIPIALFGLYNPTAGQATVLINITDKDNKTQKASSNQLVNFSGLNNVLILGGIDMDHLNSTTNFQINQTISCLLDATPFGTLNASFFRPGDSLSNPFKTFNSSQLYCPNYCYANFTVNETRRGEWTCLGGITYNRTGLKLSTNTLTMGNSLPLQIKELPSLNITSEEILTLNLSEYFQDLDSDPLQYQVTGATLLNTFVDSDSLTLADFQTLQGTENLSLYVYDGFDGLTTPFTVLVIGNESIPELNFTPVNTTLCVPLWDPSWGECLNSVQTQIWTDRNNCGQPSPEITTRPCQEQVVAPVQNITPIVTPQIEEEQSPVTPLQIIALLLGVVSVLSGLGFFIYQKRRNSLDVVEPTAVQETVVTPPPPTTESSSQVQPVTVNTQTPVEQPVPKQDLTELRNYAESALLEQGKTISDVRNELTNAGWAALDIDKILSYAGAKKFIKEKISAGTTKETLRELLKNKKWTDQTINKMFSELGI